MADELKTLEELRRSFATPRLPPRLPDTKQSRHALTQTADLHRYQPRQCVRCGGSFLVRGAGSLCAVYYCSRDCQQADRRDRRAAAREQERRRHPRKPIKCAQCGDRVPPARSTRRYCSDACRQAAYRQRQRT
jgi:hypothetical protein